MKWAGGKRWQVPHLRQLSELNRTRRLVEPFCGGLAVALGLMPERALLNDVSPHVINVYRWLKRGLTVTIPMKNDATTYYAHRVRFNELLIAGDSDTAEAAGLFLYLNRTGYNGLCRFNSRGPPTSRSAVTRRSRTRDIFWNTGACSSGSNSRTPTSKTCRCSQTISSTPTRPPTSNSPAIPWAASIGTHSSARLAGSRSIRSVVLSNQWTDRIVELYKDLGFDIVGLTAPRLISCTGDRTPAKEVIATRNISVDRLTQVRPFESVGRAAPESVRRLSRAAGPLRSVWRAGQWGFRTRDRWASSAVGSAHEWHS